LRDMKRNPYVDSQIKVRWPWQTESLVIKAGPCLVIGNGALYLGDKPIVSFSPEFIPAFGGKTTLLTTEIIDKTGAAWIRIQRGELDACVGDATDFYFTPQTREFRAVHVDDTELRLRFWRVRVDEFEGWFRPFVRPTPKKNANSVEDWVRMASEEVQKQSAVDDDGFVPIIELRGAFEVAGNRLQITEKQLVLDVNYPWQESVSFHTQVPGATLKSATLRLGEDKSCIFSIG